MWYCCHNHFSLVVRMVVRYMPVLSYRCVSSPCVCMVLYVVVISFSGLHSIETIWMCGIIAGGVICLVSLDCIGVKCISMMFL